MRGTPFLLVPLLLLACGKGEQVDPVEDLGFEWSGGDFQFTTWQVEDTCMDGALEALFMPEGPDSPWDFEYEIYLPGYEELPLSYDIDLRAPFLGMPVDVDADSDGTFQVRGSVMEAVELGAAAYGDCVVTMSVDADMTPRDSDTADGEARVSLSNARGDDGRCPVLSADPCTVTMLIEATRL